MKNTREYKRRGNKYAHVVGTVVNLRKAVRRNSTCPFCTSGRKFKHCCLHVANAAGYNAGIPFGVAE